MKTPLIVTASLVTCVCLARIGDTPKEAEQRYGKPTLPLSAPKIALGPAGIMNAAYTIPSGIKISESYLDGKCEYAIYTRPKYAAFSIAELKEIAKANAGNRKLMADLSIDSSEGINSYIIKYDGLTVEAPSHIKLITIKSDKYITADSQARAARQKRYEQQDADAAKKTTSGI